MPVGSIIAWALEINPDDSYLECNGQSVDSSKYPKLYALMHNTPDYRGVFLRGLGGNSAALGTLQGDAIRNITGTFGLEAKENSAYKNLSGVFFSAGNVSGNASAPDGSIDSLITFDASRVVPVANENRPINKAVRYFIKAR